MPYYNNQSLANAGLYRQTLEHIMYGPADVDTSKKDFHDETLANIKKVSKLREKWETGNLELTIDENEEAKEAEPVVEEGEDVCDGPGLTPVPTPRTRTIFAKATPQALNKGIAACFEPQPLREVVETPILKLTTHGAEGSRRHYPSKTVQNMATPTRHTSAIKRLDFDTNATETPILQSSTGPVVSRSNVQSEMAKAQNRRTPRRQTSVVNCFDLPSELVETPILRTPSRQVSGVSCLDFETEVVETPILRTPARQVSAASRPRFETEVIETPILRTASRQVSGSSLIDDYVKTANLKITQSPSVYQEVVEHPRQKTISAGSSGSSDSCGSSGSTDPPKKLKTSESAVSFNTKHKDYYCKLARAQVHNRFTMYYNWSSGSIRAIAAAVSKMRLKVLQQIPERNRSERMSHVMTIYENCTRGVNKEMDALCCSLFDLMDDVNEKTLSVHEEYVAVKYRKKYEQANA